MHWMNWGGDGWFMMSLWWIIIAVGIVFLIKLVSGSSSQSASQDSALEILKRRYASGEISKKEFEAMKKDLG